MLIPRQSQSCSTKRMDIFQPNSSQVKRNVARKSTSNRPLKNSTNTFETNKSILSYNHSANYLKRSSLDNVKYNAPISEKAKISDVKTSPQHIIDQNVSTFKTTYPVDLENYVYHEESEVDDDDIEGIFSISQGLVPFLGESNLSPQYSSDSSEEPLTTLKILNYPVKDDFPGAVFKDVPYYSNKLVRECDSGALDSDKSELVKCNLNVTFDNNDDNVVHKKGVKLVNNALPASANNKTNEDSLDITENRLVGVSVREDYVICEDRPMKMTVIQAEDFDVNKYDNVTDDINFHDDNENDETDFPKVVCAVSLGPGNELEFEDILAQMVSEENQNSVAKKKKPKKRKASSNLFFGSRSKKRTKRSCKSNRSVNNNPKSTEDLYSSQDFVTSLDDKPLKTELNVEEPSKKCEMEGEAEPDNVLNLPEGCTEPANSSLSNQSVQSNCDNVTISVDDNLTAIKSEVLSAEENEESTQSKASLGSDIANEKCIVKNKEMDSKKKNVGSADKKSKNEINEGVLLHVEAAKETEIMRDGKLLKDKKELLKDIESKIEKNLPVEVKEFDIQQSLTEEILLEQALRLAHQRTSPRRRPLLSKSETKAILSCLSNQGRYKTRKSNDKKPVDDMSSSEEKLKHGLDVSADNSDSEVKNPDAIISNESSEKLTSINQKKSSPRKTSKFRKKKNTAEECILVAQNNLTSEKLDMNILSETFENVLQEFQNVDGSSKINFLKEEKTESKGANRKKKSNKKSKNKRKSLAEIDHDLVESDAYYESAISQDSFNGENLSTGNEESKNKRIPVIIIKNKKVTITDHKSKKRRHTNNLFSIIKTRENNDIVCNKPQLVASSPSEDSNKLEIEFNSTISQQKSDTLQNSCGSSEINIECESQNSNIIIKDMCEPEQSKEESLNNNKLVTSNLELEGTGLKVNESCPTPCVSIDSSEGISHKDNEDIVEVIDMDIVEVDSPKTNSNTSQDQIVEEKVISNEEPRKTSLIPFLEGSDLSIDSKESSSNKSLIASHIEEKVSSNAKQNDNFEFPIPTISEVNTKNAFNTFQSLTTPVKSTSSFVSSLPNVSPSFTSPPPPISISLSSPFSSPTPGVHTPGMSGFTPSLPQDGISPLNPAFYPAYSLAPSATGPHFINSTTPQDCFPSSSYQPAMSTLTPSHLCNGNYLHSSSEVMSYPPPLISSGISNTIQIPPVYSTPVVQNSPLITSEIPTTNIQSPHINSSPNKQFPNYPYPPPNHNTDSKHNPRFPFLPPSNETASPVIKKDVTPPPVVNELQENNFEKSTAVSMPNSEVKAVERPVTSSAPMPEPEKSKAIDIPLSIAARDPRLRKRSLRVILDSHIISLTPVEKCENKLNIQPQSNPKSVEITENVQSAEEKSREDSDLQLKDTESKNEAVCDNEFPKKKLKKKEVDQELLYKTPLSDLHDAPERTSYSRTLPKRPVRRDPRQFPRDTNSEVALDHEPPEAQREYPYSEYSRLVGHGYHDAEPDAHMHLPDSQRIEDYEQNNEHCPNDMRPDYYPRWRQDPYTQDVKRPREYGERRPLLETPSEYRRVNYRQRENYGDVHARAHDYSQDLRRQNDTDYRRRGPDVSVYPRWDYAHKRIEGIFPPEIPELEKPYSSKISEEDQSHQELWEDENEIRDLIEGPIPSASRPFYRRKRFSKPWRPAHLRDDDSSSSPYCDDLFERRRDIEMRREEGYCERPWERSRNRKCDEERMNGSERDDRRYHRSGREGRSRSPRRDYEMYEKKRARSPRRRERNRGPGRGSLSPRNSPLDLESPMSPEPEEIPYAEPPKYLPIPQ